METLIPYLNTGQLGKFFVVAVENIGRFIRTARTGGATGAATV